MHRLLQEPKRLWRRYLAAAVWFPLLLLFQLSMLAVLRISAAFRRTADVVTETASVAGFVTARNWPRLQALLLGNGKPGHRVAEVDARNLLYLDSVALGSLVATCREMSLRGSDVRFKSVPGPIRRVAAALKLESVLKCLSADVSPLQTDVVIIE